MKAYWVRANDNETDTCIQANSKKEVREILSKNKWWIKNNLTPEIIEELKQTTKARKGQVGRMKWFCFKHWIFKDDGECQICGVEKDELLLKAEAKESRP